MNLLCSSCVRSMENEASIWHQCSCGLHVGRVKAVAHLGQKELGPAGRKTSISTHCSQGHVPHVRDIEVHDLLQKRTKLFTLQCEWGERSSRQVILNGDQSHSSTIFGVDQICMECPKFWLQKENVLGGQCWIYSSASVLRQQS